MQYRYNCFYSIQYLQNKRGADIESVFTIKQRAINSISLDKSHFREYKTAIEISGGNL